MSDTRVYSGRPAAVDLQAKMVLEHLPVLVWVVDAEGCLLHVEGKALALFGGSEATWVGQSAASLFSGDEAKQQGINRALEGVSGSEISQIQGRWIETHYSPLYDANGDIEGVSGLTIDVSDRHDFARQLENVAKGVSAQTGDSFFRSLTFHLAQALDVDIAFVGRLSEDGTRVTTCAVCSQGELADNFTYELANTPCENLLDQGVCSYADDVHLQFSRDRELAEQGIRGYVGAPLLDASGKVLGILVVLSRQPLTDVARVENLLTIFSSRAAAELQRERDDSQLMVLSQVVEQGPMSIVITNAEGCIEYVNPEFCRRMGYSLTEVLGLTPRVIKSEHTPAEHFRQLWSTIKSGRVWRGLMINRARDGREVVENQVIAPIRGEDGEISHFVAIKEDLSQLHHSEANLRRINGMMALLSSCNKALVRSQSEGELLERVMGLIARQGEYEMVWLGRLEPAALKPMALAGDAGQRLAPVFLQPEIFDLSCRARDASSTLVLQADESLDVPLALSQQQILSAIVLPVSGSSLQVDACLWICSRNENAFDPQLRTLMEELAEDLAFGMVMQRTRLALKESEAQFRSLAEDSMVGIYMIQDGQFVYANPEMHRVFGYQPGEIVGQRSVRDLVSPEDRERVEFNLSQRVKGEVHSIHYDFIGERKDGARVWVDVYGARTEHEGKASVVGTLLDVTERRSTEDRLQLMDRAISAAGDGIAIMDVTDPGFPLVYANPAFETITGYSFAELQGKNAFRLLFNDANSTSLDRIQAAVAEGEGTTLEVGGYHQNGSLFWAELSVAPVTNSAGIINHYIAVVSDISERKSYEQQLENLSNYDQLTGLANKALMRDRLSQALIQAQRRGQVVALMMVDLDRFRLLTQSVGMVVSDQVLKRIGQRLEGVTRKGDTVARLESDNYAVVLSDLTSLDDVAPKAYELMEAVSRIMDLDTLSVNLTCSIGIAVYPQDGQDAQSLLRNAEAALFKAMEEKNSFRFYTSTLNATAHQRLSLEAELSRACTRNEFELFYQPKVLLADSRVFGVEALIRWRHPERGLVSPAEFIPVAEDSGMISQIGAWALEEACNAMVRINRNCGTSLSVAVNLSARQFNDNQLCQRIERVLQTSGLEPSLLELELTESMLMHEPEQALQVLAQIKALGGTVALDDFGTGYSSLAYLKRFPIDTLKIDRSFIRDIAEDSQDRAITRAVIALAETLELKVVAEGIETEFQREFLLREGCYSMQGFLFSRPLPEPELLALLAAHSPDEAP
ncbi:EAL domain-containing protein [Aestuariirhabdus litorea]|uniref:cyclic-guanylate-specific phosphodiesterase n=1 Tax=Aestuariirhabdus litorea TaxID=2528527 RepID=A0A3P3VLK3_9GAMM|nr:EAL domain-containing protein [Aestuariirhabdus litorea]RRJ83631.1 PAS domain S-box protein [Aestuariirhabdus litorea]RWW96852.1 PAS domain S-box protein [Endozoicomonadaceae bacterium GTF-13]